VKRCLAAIEKMNDLLGWLSGLCIALASLLIIVEIAGRVIVGSSLQVTDEYTGYLMAVSSMLGLGYVEKNHGHIRMDLIYLLQARFPGAIRALRLWAYATGAVFAGYLACVGWRLFYQSYVYGSKSMQISATPLAIPQFFLPLGAAVLLLQYLCNFYKHATGLSPK
jgi:TRAP-type C4-dicarboxylate transport system permease small subunit